MKRGFLRLLRLREQTEAVDEVMRHERRRFDALREREPVKAVSAHQLFQTPEHIAERMAERLAELVPTGGRMLEPSAGLGRLYHAAKHLSDDWTLCEVSAALCEHIWQLPVKLVQDDFLAVNEHRLGGLFSAILMNPPFQRRADIKHFHRAHELLEPGGVIVGLCYDGVRQNRDFRPLVDSWELLPSNSFSEAGTRAGVALVTWTKGNEEQ